MADFDIRYRLDLIQATLDGSGMVIHQVVAEASIAGADEWVTVPARHKGIAIPAIALQAALSEGTNGEIVTAYKVALVANLNTGVNPLVGWDRDTIELMMNQNADALAAQIAALSFIQDDLGLTLPVPFNI